MLQASVGFIPSVECDAAYFPYLQRLLMDETLICVSSPGKNACEGDRGGSLLISCDATGEDRQVGIVSAGLSCASPRIHNIDI